MGEEEENKRETLLLLKFYVSHGAEAMDQVGEEQKVFIEERSLETEVPWGVGFQCCRVQVFWLFLQIYCPTETGFHCGKRLWNSQSG